MKKCILLILFLQIIPAIASESLLMESFNSLEFQKKCAFFRSQEKTNIPDCVANHSSKSENLNKDIKNTNNQCCFVKIPTQIPSNVEIPEPIKDKQLSFYWAQELIGSDLLKEELKDMGNTNTPINFITIVDQKNQEKNPRHPEYVCNLISDNDYHSIIPELSKENIKSFEDLRNQQNISDITTTIENEKPSLVNISLSWNDNLQETATALNKIISTAHSTNSIIVISAGNIEGKNDEETSNQRRLCNGRADAHNYPIKNCFVDTHKVNASTTFNAILTGSLSPNGQPSDFSKKSSEVSILAPSDNYLTSADKDGNYFNFGGTSGAAPLVTGSLAAFEWLSGYHPTGEEAKILLEKTAIPTQSSKCNGKHGKGILNTYRLGLTALNLKEKCDKCKEQCNDNQYPHICQSNKCNQQKCFKDKIQLPNTYQFSFDSQEYEKIKTKFPECDKNSSSNKIIPCDEKRTAFKELRKAVLLHPQKAYLWDTLSCVYEKNGFTQNANMLKKIKDQIQERCPVN